MIDFINMSDVEFKNHMRKLKQKYKEMEILSTELKIIDDEFMMLIKQEK